MSENQTNVPAGTPIIINTTAPAPTPVGGEPAQLAKGKTAKAEALAEAKAKGANEILKGLGVKKAERARMVEEIRAGRVKIAEAKEVAAAANQVAAKIDADAQIQADAFKPYKDQVDSLTSTLKEYADAEFNALPEPFQKTIVEMKLDDPAKRLEMIKVFKKTGVLGGTTAATTTSTKTDETKTGTAASKSTTMAQTPGDVKTPPGPSQNHYEQWRALTDSGQDYLAAQYLNAHRIQILEQRPKR